MAHELDASCSRPGDLNEQVQALVRTIAKALKEARRALVVSGAACGSEALIRAPANVAWALRGAGREGAVQGRLEKLASWMTVREYAPCRAGNEPGGDCR